MDVIHSEVVDTQGKKIIFDYYNAWSKKSKDIIFKSNKKCVGNGEEKLAKELEIIGTVGGQNKKVDLVHPVLGNISVKEMTNDDCTLGTDGCKSLREIFRKIVQPFVCWASKYHQNCKLAKEYYDSINQKYGSARTTLLEGIDSFELANGGNKSPGNLPKLVNLLEKLKKDKKNSESGYKSLVSEYVDDILYNLGEKNLQELLDDCVRKEATTMNLIIVHETKGWLLVKDTSRISCPRITRGAPRINYS